MTKQKVPKLRFPEFTGEWKIKKLGELSSVITKGTTPKYFSKKGIKFIKIECFNRNKILKDKCLFIDEETHNKKLKRSILKENDILFAIAGATIGKCNIVKKDILPANTNQALSIIRLHKNENKIFVLNILKSNKMKRYIKLNISVGAQPNLNLEQINNFILSTPSLPEQEKIADFLTLFDKEIELEEKKLELLKENKKGYMQKIFNRDLRFKDEFGNDYPQWEEKKLGEIFKEIKEKSIKKNQYSVISSTKDGLFYQNEYFKRNIASEDNKGYKILKKNEIVLSPQNLWLGNINYNDKYKIGLVSPSYKIFKINNNILKDYMKYIIKTPYAFYNYEQASEKGASIVRRNLNMDLFYLIKFQIPSLPEQEKIANFLSMVDEEIELMENKIEKLKEVKKGLLQEMFI